MSDQARSVSSTASFTESDCDPTSQVRWSFAAARDRIAKRLTTLRDALDDRDTRFRRAHAFGMLEEIIFDVTNEFSEEEMLLMKHDEQRWFGHRCSHDALLSAMQAAKRAVMRCRRREDLRVTVDAISDWLQNHYRTVDARDAHLLGP